MLPPMPCERARVASGFNQTFRQRSSASFAVVNPGHSIKWFSIPKPVKMVTSWLEHFDFVAGDRYGGLVATVGGFGIV